jgi:uncharacterized protein YprB with RNaseH-like and TPR domain
MRAKRTKVLKEESRGEYTVRFCVDQSYRIIGPGTNPKYGFVLPPISRIARGLDQDMRKNNRASNSTNTYLKFLGVIAAGKRSQKEGRKLLNATIKSPPTLETIKQALREFYPTKDIQAAIRGELELQGVTPFAKTHNRPYILANKKHNGLRGVLSQMESPYPKAVDLIYKVTTREGINPQTLGEQLFTWFCQGRSINIASLGGFPKKSPERRAHNYIHTLVNSREGNLFGRTKSPTKMVSKLTGLSEEDIRLSRGDSKQASILAESLVSLVYHWIQPLGLQVQGVNGFEIFDEATLRKFHYLSEGEEPQIGFADLRVGNSAIEVKGYFGIFSGTRRDNLIKRYGNPIKWDSGERVDQTTLVFHQPKETYAREKSKIQQAGIEIMDHARFYSVLERVIERMKKRPQLIQGLEPLVNLDYLLKLDREILDSTSLFRESDQERKRWSFEGVNALVRRAKDIRRSKQKEIRYQPPDEQRSNLEIPGAEVINHKGNQFLKLETKFTNVNAPELVGYINENSDSLKAQNIRDKLGISANKNQILAFDLETTGLAYKDPVTSIGYARFEGKSIVSGVLYARDFSEEKPMLDYFLEMMQGRFLLTYNGNSFDLPRLEFRTKHNGLFLPGNGSKSLKETVTPNHFDLRGPATRKYGQLSDGKLATLEKIVLRHERRIDISGKEIPEAYMGYMRGFHIDAYPLINEWGEEFKDPETGKKAVTLIKRQADLPDCRRKLKKSIEHNLIDSVVLMTLLTKLCT